MQTIIGQNDSVYLLVYLIRFVNYNVYYRTNIVNLVIAKIKLTI